MAVAEERHFTRAAHRLNIVQSGLSASIRALEEELGAPLFQRSTRRVEMTTAGRTLVAEARRVLAAARDAREAVAAVQGLQRGKLRIGTNSEPRTLSRSAGPDRAVPPRPSGDRDRALPGRLGTADRQVRDGQVDLAFTQLFDPMPQDMVARMLACEGLVVACAPSHPLAGQHDVSLAQLASETFIELQNEWGMRRLVDHSFASSGLHRHIAFEVNDVTMLFDVVALNLGVALMPEAVVAARRADRHRPPVAYFELPPPEPCWELAVIFAAGGHLNGVPGGAAARAFLDLISPGQAVM